MIDPRMRDSYLEAIDALNSLLAKIDAAQEDEDGMTLMPKDRIASLLGHFRNHLVETMPNEEDPHVTH